MEGQARSKEKLSSYTQNTVNTRVNYFIKVPVDIDFSDTVPIVPQISLPPALPQVRITSTYLMTCVASYKAGNISKALDQWKTLTADPTILIIYKKHLHINAAICIIGFFSWRAFSYHGNI